MRAKVQYTVSFKINEGRLEDFKRIAVEMTEISRSEPGTLAYDWYFSDCRNHCRLLEAYESAEAAGLHMHGRALREFVPQLLATCTPTCFEVYGEPGPEAREVLGKLGATVFNLEMALRG